MWFLAVGTDYMQIFDYLREKRPRDGFKHDVEHWERAEYEKYPQRLPKVAFFKNHLREKITDETEKKLASLAFFYLFHERQASYDTIKDKLTEMISNFKEEPKRLYQISTDNYFYKYNGYPQDFDSIEMLEVDIKNAKSCGITIEGKDAREQKKNFVDTLYAGYALLLKYADAYDNYTPLEEKRSNNKIE